MGNQLAKARRIGKQIRKAPTLPVEILLEIVSRADPTTLIRFAASSKHLRRHITDPAFLHHYHADAGFVPSLLIGMFRQHGDDEPYRFVSLSPSTAKLTLQLTTQPPTDAAGGLFDSYIPIASRAGLLLLRRRRCNLTQLCVCSPLTGRYSYLPTMTVEYDFLHLLLPGDDDDKENTGDSFRLLVMDHAYQTQIFSSKTGSWCSITETPGVLPCFDRVQPAAVVLRGVAHWLCHEWPSGPYKVLAIHLGDGHAAAIGEVPELCLRRRRTGPIPRRNFKDLVSTDGRQLGLLVAEVLVISLWTLSEDSKTWGARRVVVNRINMLRSVEPHYQLLACIHVDLEWFGEASGAVVLWAEGAGILVLNLRTNEISQLGGHSEHVLGSFRCCPYEVDLVSLIAGLKPF
ncbi:hypothetical protein ACQ4PT_038567 [Festuca glaucescens]